MDETKRKSIYREINIKGIKYELLINYTGPMKIEYGSGLEQFPLKDAVFTLIKIISLLKQNKMKILKICLKFFGDHLLLHASWNFIIYLVEMIAFYRNPPKNFGIFIRVDETTRGDRYNLLEVDTLALNELTEFGEWDFLLDLKLPNEFFIYDGMITQLINALSLIKENLKQLQKFFLYLKCNHDSLNLASYEQISGLINENVNPELENLGLYLSNPLFEHNVLARNNSLINVVSQFKNLKSLMIALNDCSDYDLNSIAGIFNNESRRKLNSFTVFLQSDSATSVGFSQFFFALSNYAKTLNRLRCAFLIIASPDHIDSVSFYLPLLKAITDIKYLSDLRLFFEAFNFNNILQENLLDSISIIAHNLLKFGLYIKNTKDDLRLDSPSIETRTKLLHNLRSLLKILFLKTSFLENSKSDGSLINRIENGTKTRKRLFLVMLNLRTLNYERKLFKRKGVLMDIAGLMEGI